MNMDMLTSRQVDPVVFHMAAEDPGAVDYSQVGGLSEQLRELREVRLSPYRQNNILAEFSYPYGEPCLWQSGHGSSNCTGRGAAAEESRTVRPRGYQGTERRPPLRSSRYLRTLSLPCSLWSLAMFPIPLA